jgi:hypothetical protein
MASSGNGTGPLSSTGGIQRGVASSQAGDGPIGRGTKTRQLLNLQITENKAILAEEGCEYVELQHWICHMAKKYLKMCHIDKFFPRAVWEYNLNVYGVNIVRVFQSTLCIVR